jgi:hypothetical protein
LSLAAIAKQQLCPFRASIDATEFSLPLEKLARLC